MSIRVIDRVFKSSRSRNGARLVLLALADYADDEGRSYPSVEGLMQKSGLSRNPVHVALRSLVKLGELTVAHSAGPRGCNVYVVTSNGARSEPLPSPATSAPLRVSHGDAPVRNGAAPLHPLPKSVPSPKSVPLPDSVPEPSGTVRELSLDKAKALSSSPAARGGMERFSLSDAVEIYNLYPRKVGRKEGLKAIQKAMIEVGKRKDIDWHLSWMIERVKKYAETRKGEDEKFTPHPATWFNAGRYDDDFTMPARKPGATNNDCRALCDPADFNAWLRASHPNAGPDVSIHTVNPQSLEEYLDQLTPEKRAEVGLPNGKHLRMVSRGAVGGYRTELRWQP